MPKQAVGNAAQGFRRNGTRRVNVGKEEQKGECGTRQWEQPLPKKKGQPALGCLFFFKLDAPFDATSDAAVYFLEGAGSGQPFKVSNLPFSTVTTLLLVFTPRRNLISP